MGALTLPAAFTAADESSQAAQRRFFIAAKIRLGLLVLAAAGGTVPVRLGATDLAAIVAATAFLGAIAVELFLLQTRPEQSWYQARAAAESIKTIAWRYAVGGDPFNLDTLAPATADRLFIRRLQSVLDQLREVDLGVTGGSDRQITDGMRKLRALPLEERRHIYDVDRLGDQQRWYTRKAAWNGRRARVWGVLTLAIEVFGGLTALIKVSQDLDSLALVLGVIATAAAGLAGWSQSKQYATLATSYALAAQELGSNRSLLCWQEDETAWAQFVPDAEDAISREHTLWRANRGMLMPADPRPGEEQPRA